MDLVRQRRIMLRTGTDVLLPETHFGILSALVDCGSIACRSAMAIFALDALFRREKRSDTTGHQPFYLSWLVI